MDIDDFAPNLSFFFSYGMDPGVQRHRPRGAAHLGGGDEEPLRRERALAEAEVPFADQRPQPARAGNRVQRHPHHAAGADLSYDNTNSLHTNAFDEAITTPTEESVRRAMAIQLIINKEWGLAKNENPNQGSFIIEELTDLVEEAVLKEFEAISARGGVLGAMETGYQRARSRKSRCTTSTRSTTAPYPIVGVNTFRNAHADSAPQKIELIRSSEDEKQSSSGGCANSTQACRESGPMLARLREAVIREPERV
jgi:methylmalonyl-CoA mutase